MAKKRRFDFTKKNKRSGKVENVGYLDLEQDEEQSRCSLYFYGDIVSATWESMWFEEDRCPQDIADFLNQLDGYEDIDIYFNSGGGDVFAGLAIYNQLKRYSGHKVGYVDGMAASIASVIMFAYINKWIAKKTKATRNAMILKVANEMTKGKEVVISTIDSLKDVFNVGLDPAITTGAMVIANQNGYNYLDKLKDKDGKYILQPNPTQPTQMMLFGKYPIVKVSNRTVKSEPVYSPAFTISGSKLAIDGTTTAIDASATSDVTAWKVVKGKYVVTCKGQEQETTVDAKVSAYKHPVYMGDLKEAITLFDRNVITIDMNDKAAGLWEKDMTGIKVRDRFDVQPVDDGAIIKGNITEVVQG